MKTRIIAEYLIEEGFHEGEREVDLDKYREVEVDSIEQGREVIEKLDLHGNGCGTIIEQEESTLGWEDKVKHLVSNGAIYSSDTV